jgi:signal peptidase I
MCPPASETSAVPVPATGGLAIPALGAVSLPDPGFLRAEDGEISFVERRSGACGIGGERRTSDAQAVAGALQSQSRVVLRVYGASMLPWVRPGDVVVIHSASPDTVRCGDVVLFRRGDRLYVHRIVEKRGLRRDARFLAKGDANPHADGIIGQEEILGRVVNLYRGNRLIDLDSPGQLILGLLLAQFSRRSRLGYLLTRVASGVARPARRVLQVLAPSSAPSR